ncbi:MAG TPA: ABC transporter permease [Verrucomicrobiae bacterium]
MTFWTLIFRSLRFHARSHLGVVLGAIIGSAAMIGALVLGDSVRGSLRDLALARLGNITTALSGNDRFFRAALADELSTNFRCAPILEISGTAASEDGTARANQIHVLGIDDRLLRIQTNAPHFFASPSVILNNYLAEHLKAKIGDILTIRVQKPSLLSREAPISPQQDFSLALRLPISDIVDDARFGRFSLRASQLPPYNAFLPLQLMQEKLDLTNRANLLVAARTQAAVANQEFRTRWQLADAELELRAGAGNAGLELRSRRVFLDPPVISASGSISSNQIGILTYFVNELRSGNSSTPYSMVSGVAPPFVPADLKDDEIIVNQWLADDLQAQPGSDLQLVYYVVGATQRLQPRTNSFRIRSIVPLSGIYADRDLLPDFPGIAKAEKTENWDAGFPIQMNRIRPKDEKYWHDYRGTPKAFITLKAAQAMWANRFGNLTAIRFPNATDSEKSAATLLQKLNPSDIGLSFAPVREQAFAASEQGQDFGELFLGFSFFLILAAIILMGLLFQFGLEQRAEEVGTFLALGFAPRTVRRLLLGEGLLLAAIGAVIGIVGGVLYARALVGGLTSIWRSAVSSSSLRFHSTPGSILSGLCASLVVCLLSMFFVLRKQARRPARELLSPGADLENFHPDRKSKGRWLAFPSGIAALAIVGSALAKGETSNAETFFSAGSLLLVCALACVAMFFAALRRSETAQRLSLSRLGLRNSTRRTRRSLATVALLASGSFMIVAVGANRLDANANATARSSGTGGFALYGESSLPVLHDLNTADGRDFYGLNEQDLQGVSVLPLRVHDGDEASCLNLNRAQSPRILGLKPNLLSDRKAFTFVHTATGIAEHGWDLLNSKLEDNAIPAIADQNSIQYALGKKVGDTITYTDERGRPLRVRLVGSVANSILQGGIFISESAFLDHFPGDSGYRMFLIDAPSNAVAQVSAVLGRSLQDVGLELTPAVQRLNAFNAVQNTYLNTFQVLGGLGLLIGTAGLGVVVLRNVLERRSELALLLALGYTRRSLHWLVLSEHAALLFLGLLAGMLAALVAIFPVLRAPGSEIHVAALGYTLLGVLLSGLVWTLVATRFALRGPLLPALRNE